jgi:hypothetical protein
MTTSFTHGSVAKITIDSVDFSQYLSEVSYADSMDSAETTALGNTAKTYVPGLDDGTFKIKGMFDPTADAALQGMKRRIVAFVYHPQGDGTGLVSFAGNCILTSYTVDTPVDDMASGDTEFQLTGPIVRTIQA